MTSVVKTRGRPANRFLFPRPHKHQRTLLARILSEWNIWLHYRRSTVAATTALCCVGTVVEKKAARDALHDLCSQGNNSLQRRCVCRSTFCLFLIASRTRDTRDSIHHTWNVTTRNLVTTNDETSKRRHESRPGMCSNHSASHFILPKSLSLSLSLYLSIYLSLLFTRYTFASIVQYSLSISFPLLLLSFLVLYHSISFFRSRYDAKLELTTVDVLYSLAFLLSRSFCSGNSCTYTLWRGTHAARPSPTGFFPATLADVASCHRIQSRRSQRSRARYTSLGMNNEETPTRYLTLRKEQRYPQRLMRTDSSARAPKSDWRSLAITVREEGRTRPSCTERALGAGDALSRPATASRRGSTARWRRDAVSLAFYIAFSFASTYLWLACHFLTKYPTTKRSVLWFQQKSL